MPKVHDVAVLGATAAGYTASLHLAAAGCDVAVLGAQGQPVECPLAQWAPQAFFKLPHMPKGLARGAKAKPFRSVVYHGLDLKRECEHRARNTLGHLLPAGGLTKALAAAATKAGVTTRSSSTAPAIRLEEDGVELIGSRSIRARLLLVAQSQPEEILNELALPVRGVPPSPLVAAGLDIPLPPRATFRRLAGALHVIQPRQRGQLAMFFLGGHALHLRIVRASGGDGQHASELSALFAALKEAEILPADLALRQPRGAVWRPPSGIALDMETHVAKRCLLVGTAGGFADYITGATLLTSARSALLGAEVALEALRSPRPQDTLMRFKSSWRDSLAEHLRPPNTSLAMLMPLLFVNRRIVAKFTDALLHGQSI